MNAIRRRLQRRRKGFSLTEVALAMLIVAIGLLTIFGLMSQSLDLGKDSTDDTQTGLFAEGVFNGIRSFLDNSNVTWSMIGTFPIPVVAPDMWDDTDQNVIKVVPNAGTRQLILRPAALPKFEEFVLRYNLQYEQDGRRLAATLNVWPGLAGTGTTSQATFYTEIYRFGKP